MSHRFAKVSTSLLLVFLGSGCRDSHDVQDADGGPADADEADVAAGDGDVSDARDADDGSPDSDAVPDGDEGAQHYCDIANGDHVNECGACFPSGLEDTVLDALTVMFPDAEEVALIGAGEEAYFAAERDAEAIGYAFLSQTWGFEGPLTCLTGVDSDGFSIRVELTAANGYEWVFYLDEEFYAQFACIDLEAIDISSRNWGPYEVDAVSGASVSSHAVIESVWLSFERYEQVVGGE